MSLDNAPDEVKLAVDLIMLLEENQVSAQTVLGALEIIKRDYENKLNRVGQAPDEADKT
ncbi:pleiotropic regulatory protein RsmS [Klebsiella sp. I138]|uniref:pleiotropic regulatory protein RsmS n=1 Tax=Klebsiella sp. I138 TaxID=2755385 RepID=UPI003DA93951